MQYAYYLKLMQCFTLVASTEAGFLGGIVNFSLVSLLKVFSFRFLVYLFKYNYNLTKISK